MTQLLADTWRTGAALCHELTAATDAWLRGLFADALAKAGAPSGRVALVAVGGYGRGELAPWSDLDLLLLHDARRGIEPVAEALWYPIWDTKLKLGHAVRTAKEAHEAGVGGPRHGHVVPDRAPPGRRRRPRRGAGRRRPQAVAQEGRRRWLGEPGRRRRAAPGGRRARWPSCWSPT